MSMLAIQRYYKCLVYVIETYSATGCYPSFIKLESHYLDCHMALIQFQGIKNAIFNQYKCICTKNAIYQQHMVFFENLFMTKTNLLEAAVSFSGLYIF